MMLAAGWNLPAGVRALTTTRGPFLDTEPYSPFNLATHVDDDEAAVAANRARLIRQCDGLEAVQWLEQVHGTRVYCADGAVTDAPVADAVVTRTPGLACAVLTADCLPVLFCNDHGTQVAAAHAGWRGLLSGVLARTVTAFDDQPASLRIWFGPCIRQPSFEVGGEVRSAFLSDFNGPVRADIEAAFIPSSQDGKFLCDLAGLAALQLRALGVQNLTDSGLCSYSDPRFYSYRRENPCGRFATLIYRRP